MNVIKMLMHLNIAELNTVVSVVLNSHEIHRNTEHEAITLMLILASLAKSEEHFHLNCEVMHSNRGQV